jgi:hypothetical protein
MNTPTTPIVLGFSGKKRAGKNYVSSLLASVLKSKGITSVVECAFADALKDEVCSAVNISRSTLDNNKETFRPLLQWWGTEFRRQIYGERYWIDRLVQNIKNNPDPYQAVIVTDVRFPNEAEAIINELGGSMWRIVNPDESASASLSTVDLHSSETLMDTYPNIRRTILNSRKLTPDHLSKILENIIDEDYFGRYRYRNE